VTLDGHYHLEEFTEGAPRIAAVFTRRHRAAGNLCMLAAEPGSTCEEGSSTTSTPPT